MSDKLNTVIDVAKELCNEIIKFLSNMKLPIIKVSDIIKKLDEIKPEYSDKSDIYTILTLIVYYNILRKFENVVIFFELSDNAEENKARVETRNTLQQKCRELTADIEKSFNKKIKTDVFKNDYTKLYNVFGFSEILRFAGGIETREIEKLKNSIMKTENSYEPENCKWTFKIDKEGVYNVSNLVKVTELSTPPITGVNHKVIKAYNTIDPTREPATYHEKHLPMRSRVAVYNATIEKMIFDKRTPCTKYQFAKVTNIPYQIINFINYDNLDTAISLDQVIDMVSADIYRIMAVKYEESNIKLIQNKREIFYYSYLGTFGVVNTIQRKLRENIKDLVSYKFPIKDYSDKLAFVARVKRIITNTVESISLNKMIPDIELSICS